MARKVNVSDFPKAKRSLPFLGHAHLIAKDPDSFFSKNNNNDNVFRANFQGKEVVYFLHPADIRQMFGFSKKMTAESTNLEVSCRIFDASLETGYAVFYDQTRIIRECITTEDGLQQHIDRFEYNLKKELSKSQFSDGAYNLYEFVTTLLFKAAGNAFFKDDVFNEQVFEDFRVFDDALPLIAGGIPSIFWRKAKQARQRMFELFQGIDIENAGPMIKERHAFFDTLNIPDSDRAGSDFSIFWATNANTINIIFWLLAHLINDRYTYQKIQTEVEAHTGLFNKESLQKMPLTNSAIFETLRFYSGSSVLRDATEDFDFPLNSGKVLQIKKGQRMGTYSRIAHHDAAEFDNHASFNLSRFIDGESLSMFPFGGGKHVCPGKRLAIAEFKIILYYLLKAFNFKSGDRLPTMDLGRLLLGSSPPTSVYTVDIKQR